MNSIEIRRLKNLKLTTKNIDQALKFYSIIQSKINDIFINYCKSKNLNAVIESISIEANDIIISFKHFDGNEYVDDKVIFSKSLLLINQLIN